MTVTRVYITLGAFSSRNFGNYPLYFWFIGRNKVQTDAGGSKLNDESVKQINDHKYPLLSKASPASLNQYLKALICQTPKHVFRGKDVVIFRPKTLLHLQISSIFKDICHKR